MRLSTLIPTRNRKDSLCRLLDSLEKQSFLPDEIIIVDASDNPLNREDLQNQFPRLRITLQVSQPSVCMQRNLGIKKAQSPYIFLCDDDIEVSEGYIATLMQHLVAYPTVGAVSGVLYHSNGSKIESEFRPLRVSSLLWKFIFQLTVWTDLEKLHSNFFGNSILYFLKKYYRRKGNSFTLAGWPLVTQVNGSSFKTKIYGLGAAIVRKDWLLQSPYDEILDTHGIGDNYGVALNFRQDFPIVVLPSTYSVHHESEENRLAPHLTYFRRILALHYFIARNKQFTRINKVFLLWSLAGNLIYHLNERKKKWIRATVKAMVLILTGKNPYLLGTHRQQPQPINPEL